MSLKRRILIDWIITAIILVCSFVLCLLLQSVFEGNSLIPGIFILGIFLTSVITKWRIYGIVSSLLSVFVVNYAFTFPFFKFNFTIPENIVSAVIMVIISLVTSSITSKLKRQEIIEAEREREKTRANLLRAVSHDLRTPLTTIYGSSCALLDSKTKLTEEQKTKMLNGIRQDSFWLFRMVENLLSVTRLDGENVKIIKTPTVLDELIDSVIIKFHYRYPKQKVTLDIPDSFTTVPMDALLIEQVLINFLDNAVEHAHGMDKLTLKVYIRFGKAIFEVSDNGCGIPPDRLKDIFGGCSGSYSPSPDCKRRSAGIGLSVCDTIVKAHGGKIEAGNLKSGGAYFRFALDAEEYNNDWK